MNLDFHHKYVDIAMDIPAQPGLLFDVHLNLQNVDELHLKKVDRYFEAVSALLSGQFRILEHWRGKRVVRSELQRPDGAAWKTTANWLTLSALIPWPRKTFKVVQNLPGVESHA